VKLQQILCCPSKIFFAFSLINSIEIVLTKSYLFNWSHQKELIMKLKRFLGVKMICAGITNCGQDVQNNSEAANIPYPGGVGPQWLYNGSLVALDKVTEVVVSLKGNTVRVTGELTNSYSENDLPYYAQRSRLSSGRLQITVVYPIATANTKGFNDSGSPIRNATAKTHPQIQTVLRKTQNEIAEWGGFPFLIYEPGRGIGFHGPITHKGAGGSQWQLMRGPVSHGCNRMQGEHLLELATLLGLDLSSKVYTRNEGGRTLNVAVRVMAMSEGYDEFQGSLVDVDYPATSGLVRPVATSSQSVNVFKTWDAMKLTRFACQYNTTSGLGSAKCNHRPANSINPKTGGAVIAGG
jgi:hypothetical protein